LLTTAEKILLEDKTAGINMDKTVPKLQTNQKSDGGDFLIILNSLMFSGKIQLKKISQASYCKKKLQMVEKSFRIKVSTCCRG